jgi:hypothetical protein
MKHSIRRHLHVIIVWCLARPFPSYLLKQVQLRQVLFGSSDGGARKVVLLQRMVVFIVVARWPKDIFIIFITFGFFVL